MRSPVPCIRLSPTLPYLLPPLLSKRRLLSIRFIRSFLEESVYQVNPIPLNGEHEIRRTLSAPSLSIFLLALFLRVTKQRFSGLVMEYLVFLELNRVKRWTRKEGCMIERSYRLSWIEEARRWWICDKNNSFFFLSFSSSQRVATLRNIICESFFPIPLFLILRFSE